MVGLAGCSPTFNWREVPLGPDGAKALLPCKPDRAERPEQLGRESVMLQMVGCKAGGATFALAWMPAGDVEQARVRLAHWRAATRARWPAAQIEEQPASYPRAAPEPAPVALTLRAAAGNARMLWFAHTQPDGRNVLYQAIVLGVPRSAAASKTFFDGVSLP